MNKVFLIGRLTKDPEMRTTANGVSVTNFSIAVNRPFMNQSGERGVDFFNCIIWRKPAENVAKYCTKGTQVCIEGRVENRSYDAQDGAKKYITEIQCDNVTFLGAKNEGGNNNNNSYNDVADNTNNDGYNQDIATTDISEDPFKDFGNEVALSDDDLPF